MAFKLDKLEKITFNLTKKWFIILVSILDVIINNDFKIKKTLISSHCHIKNLANNTCCMAFTYQIYSTSTVWNRYLFLNKQGHSSV